MAIIHTNYASGNDTTGNGSTTTPYKTVSKALSVAVDNDTVKVAGGEFQAIAGATVTTTNRGTSVSTSIDLTSHFSAGDSIFFDTSADDGFPMPANGMVITVITSTTITLAAGSHIKAGTYTPYKLSTYHYTGNGVTYETPTTITASTVAVEGGWDATFTTQIGWTGVKSSITTPTSNFYSAWSSLIKPNIVFNKFLFSNIANAFAGSASSIGINEVVFNRVNVPFGTSNFGVYAPTAIGFSTIYAYNTNMSGSWNGSGNRPTTLNLKQWITTAAAANNGIKLGFALQEGNTSGPFIRSIEAYWRSMGIAANDGQWAPIMAPTLGDIYIDDLTMCIGGATILSVMFDPGTANGWRWVGNLDVINIDGSRSGIAPFKSGFNTSALSQFAAPLNVNKTSGVFEDLPWMSYGTPTASNTLISCQRSPIYGKDTEGQKVVNMDNIVKYADPTQYVTGVNSLRCKIITTTSGGDQFRYLSAILNKPTATSSFTVTMKLKASKTLTLNNPELLYGPAYTKFGAFTPSTTTLTTSWQDITFTVDPTTLTDWNLANDGLMQVFVVINSGQIADPSEVAYVYIDSVTYA